MKLVIATPVDGAEVVSARVTLGWADSIRQLSHEIPIEATTAFAKDVVRSRNRLAALALKAFPDMTHVLWWDDDNWPEDRSIVRKMIDTGEHLIGAPYTNKKPPLRWVHQLLNPCPVAVDGVQEVRSVGFGFTITSRHCLETLSAENRRYRDDALWQGEPVKPSNIFGQLYEPLELRSEHYCPEEEEFLLSEDFSFCKRWRDRGGRVALYCGAGLIHHAGTRGWSAKDMPGGVIG